MLAEEGWGCETVVIFILPKGTRSHLIVFSPMPVYGLLLTILHTYSTLRETVSRQPFLSYGHLRLFVDVELIFGHLLFVRVRGSCT